ncbi:MAG: hypothetical protein OXF56_23855 [Rhodobacteraceae bacterium]|nr:hypothetical protein [Paracoccaceae bacterium]
MKYNLPDPNITLTTTAYRTPDEAIVTIDNGKITLRAEIPLETSLFEKTREETEKEALSAFQEILSEAMRSVKKKLA